MVADLPGLGAVRDELKEGLPLVSVVIPCFNAEKYIRRCILSVINQENPNVEILVYDDASTDESARILKELKREHQGLRLFFGDVNVGAGVVRKKLLESCAGSYIAFLDSDDYWFPEKLKVQIERIIAGRGDLCICSYQIENDHGELIGFRRAFRWINLFTLHLSNWIPNSMVLFRADLASSICMPEVRRRQDYAFWLKLFAANSAIKYVFVPECMGSYRRHAGSLSSSWRKNFTSTYSMFYAEMEYGFIASLFFTGCVGFFRLFKS